MHLVPHIFRDKVKLLLWVGPGLSKRLNNGCRDQERVREIQKTLKNLRKSYKKRKISAIFLTYFYILFPSILTRNSISWQNNWTKVGLV